MEEFEKENLYAEEFMTVGQLNNVPDQSRNQPKSSSSSSQSSESNFEKELKPAKLSVIRETESNYQQQSKLSSSKSSSSSSESSPLSSSRSLSSSSPSEHSKSSESEEESVVQTLPSIKHQSLVQLSTVNDVSLSSKKMPLSPPKLNRDTVDLQRLKGILESGMP